MERIPKPGEFYRHFKDKLYQVLAVAKHTETGEQMVVYQALYGDYGIYVRPLSMFTSEVDRKKYPNVEQKYRFENVQLGKENDLEKREGLNQESDHQVWKPKEPEEPTLNPLVHRFVEAETFAEKMETLAVMKGKIGQEELDVLYVFLDLPQGRGDVGEQLKHIETHLQMQRKYDGNRLR